MKLMVYGATGMVGQGAVNEAIKASDVEEILCVGRRELKVDSSKVSSMILDDMFDQSKVYKVCSNYDACFFCLGTTSMGKTEEEYKRITYDLAIETANSLSKKNPNMVFVYVCAKGSDQSESGPVMWARIRGKLENDLFKTKFKSVYSLRPNYIQPMDGIKSRTLAYRILYDLVGFLYPLIKKVSPNSVTSTRNMGRSMLALARGYQCENILDPEQINKVSEI